MYIENNGKLGVEQAGFRKGFSTIDHIYTMHTLLDLYLQNGNRIYCAFIDYKKAFDLIDRSKLWLKLLDIGINGKLFNVIHNLYQNAKSCVQYGSVKSESCFNCNIGVRQGENMSPLLFAIYLNDFESALSTHYNGLNMVAENVNSFLSNFEDIEVFFKMYTLLYADDTVVMAESAEELQLALNAVHTYCNECKLTVNTSKTKVVIFSRGKVRNKPVFKFGEDVIDITDDYKYLGCVLNYNGRFNKTINERICNARRAMYGLLTKSNLIGLPLDIVCELFDTLVIPVLLYGCEIWGIENTACIEKFHTKFCKLLLKLSNNTANCIALGELGRLKLKRVIDKRIISYWCKLISGNENKISCILYRVTKDMFDTHMLETKWLTYVKGILDNCGFSNMWESNTLKKCNIKWLQTALHLKLDDIAKQEWLSEVSTNSLCLNYRIFKTECCLSNYILTLDTPDRITLCKFRCGNHRLPITTGRYTGINREDRTCPLCNSNDIADEFHFIFICTYFAETRNALLKPNFKRRPNTVKMHQLFNSKDKVQLKNLAKFIKTIMNYF